MRYLYQAQPELEVVAVEDDRAIVDAIDERTLLVPISHVLFKNAEIQDVEPIVRRAHEAGAYVVLDCYQSAGVVPFDLTALDVDFAVGGSVKWLCGGPGAGWLYVRPDLAERLEPTFVGWQGHARPFAFEPELEYAPGARALPHRHPERARALRGDRRLRRDRGGRRAADPRALARAHAAPDRPAGRGRARGRRARASRRGAAARCSSARRTTPPCTASSASAGSSATSGPDAGVRLGPHFFNTEDELRHTVEQLADIVEQRRLSRAMPAPPPASSRHVPSVEGAGIRPISRRLCTLQWAGSPLSVARRPPGRPRRCAGGVVCARS